MTPNTITKLKQYFAFDADAALIAENTSHLAKDTLPLVAHLAADARKHTLEEYINLNA